MDKNQTEITKETSSVSKCHEVNEKVLHCYTQASRNATYIA